MKTTLLIMISATMLFGCKAAKDLSEKPSEGIGGLQVPKERNYTESELVIGRRICSALKHKRELFETVTNMQEKFRLRGETKICDNPNPFNLSEFTVAISNASSSDFEYIATTNRPNYFKDVMTDQTGALKVVCEGLSSSNNVSNTMLMGSSYVTVSFLISEGFDRFELFKRSKNSSGDYKLVSTEAVSVITQRSQADEKFFGVEKYRVRNNTCPNSNDYSSVKQTWLSALTSF